MCNQGMHIQQLLAILYMLTQFRTMQRVQQLCGPHHNTPCSKCIPLSTVQQPIVLYISFAEDHRSGTVPPAKQ